MYVHVCVVYKNAECMYMYSMCTPRGGHTYILTWKIDTVILGIYKEGSIKYTPIEQSMYSFDIEFLYILQDVRINNYKLIFVITLFTSCTRSQNHLVQAIQRYLLKTKHFYIHINTNAHTFSPLVLTKLEFLDPNLETTKATR